MMYDMGFTPRPATHPLQETKAVLSASIEHGLGNRPVRFVMLAAPFTSGVSIYVFYALQPFLLDLYGDPKAYSIAGLAAAIVAGAQIAGGFAAVRIRGPLPQAYQRRARWPPSPPPSCSRCSAWWRASGWRSLLLAVSGLLFAAVTPIRSAYINDMIPSQQRATVLSFDSLMGSTRRRRDPAGARQGRRRLELRHVVRGGERLPARSRSRSCC